MSPRVALVGLLCLGACANRGSATNLPLDGAPVRDSVAVVIPPPPDLCAPFHIRYAGLPAEGGIDPEACPTIECGCASYSGPLPSPTQGCVVSVDCAAYCKSEAWLNCVLLPCTKDADCGDGSFQACVVGPDATEGVCESGTCVDAGDCPTGSRCVAVEDDGTRSCIDPLTNQQGACDVDGDCPGGRCLLPAGSFHGTCSTGANFEPCYRPSDCTSGLSCQPGAPDAPGSCSDGSSGARCSKDGDCQVGTCLLGVCTSGKLNESCNGSAGCQSGFCAFKAMCSDGAADAPCGGDDECASGRCAQNAAIAACTTGAAGSKCVDDANCLSARCDHATGFDPVNTFGACR